METIQIVFIVFAILGLVLSVIGFGFMIVCPDDELPMIVLLFGMMITITCVYIGHNVDTETEVKKAETKIEQGATVYIDGNEVENPDKLILEDYKITFKDGSVILND